MSDDAAALIEQTAHAFLAEVPALEPIKLIVSVELRGRGDVQQFRLEMPGVKVARAPAPDARLRVEMQRSFLNAMAGEKARVADWVEAFTYGKAKASGPEQYMRLIEKVVDKELERQRTKRARSHPAG